MQIISHGIAACVAMLLAACAAGGPANAPAAAQAASSPSGADQRIAGAATTPLSDLNLVHAEIPPALAAARRAPYGAPVDRSCATLAAEIRTLDAALGADLDTQATAADPSLVERGAGAVGDSAVGALRGAAEGVVPFRGWVRKLTGAERYSKDVASAIAAGTIRRAYLKGLGQAQGCAAPAAPRTTEDRT